MKNLKTYINIEIRKGLMQNCPFENVTIKIAEAERIFLTKEELKRYWEKYNSRVYRITSTKYYATFYLCTAQDTSI